MRIYDNTCAAWGEMREHPLFSGRKIMLLKSKKLNSVCANYNYRLTRLLGLPGYKGYEGTRVTRVLGLPGY